MTIRELITKFSTEAPVVNQFTETLRMLTCDCTIGEIAVSAEIEAEPDLGLNARDHISINLSGDEGVLASYMSENGNNWHAFIQAVKDNESEENINLTVNVGKDVVDGRVSLYDTEAYTSHLEGRNFEAVLHEYDREIGGAGTICVEMQQGNLATWQTRQIAFVNRGDEMPVLEIEGLADVASRQPKVCSTSFHLNSVTPNTFLVTEGKQENNGIQTSFLKCAQVLCYYYLFDQTYISRQEITYKMVGLKTLNGSVTAPSIERSGVNTQTVELYTGVFNWLYEGGNIYDKTSIARNVLSLNIEDNTLLLGKHTLDAIIGNFNIYEKENAKQYIEVKNKVTETVSKMQKEIIGVIDDYTGGFLKIMTANLTFFLTTIIIRVLAKNIKENVLLPNEILYLSYALLVVSLCYLFYSRSDAMKRKQLKESHFAQLKERYEKILGDLELTNLSFDFDETKEGTTANYIKDRISCVTWLWSICLGVIAIAITGILISNLAG